MKIYCFGNEFLEQDLLAKKIADELKIDGVEFVKTDSPEELFLEEERIVILDVVDKIDNVILIGDIDKLKENDMVSLHDFDLSYFLKLKKEMGQVKDVVIIGIPMIGDITKIKEGIIEKIKTIQI